MSPTSPPSEESAGQTPSLIGVATYDYASGTWSWSPEMYRLAGFEDEGGDPAALVFARMHPDDREPVAANLAETIRVGGRLAGQYRVRDDHGGERTIAFVGETERDLDGVPVRLRGLGFDVTEGTRRAADEAVQAATSDRAAIEQAKGALMFAYRIDADAAFALLVQVSQRTNVRVSALAKRVAGLLAEPAEPGEDPTMLDVLERATSDPVGAGRPADA